MSGETAASLDFRWYTLQQKWPNCRLPFSQDVWRSASPELKKATLTALEEKCARSLVLSIYRKNLASAQNS